MEEGVDGLLRDKTRPLGISPIADHRVREIVALTLAPPPHEATHWTLRAMASVAGVAASTVQTIWKAHGLVPHRFRQFELSNDPRFVEKLHDIVGLYVSPPAHAVVLSIDEKSQIQALDRTQPGLPLKKGRGATMTHEYKRNGTTTLFAALNVLDAKRGNGGQFILHAKARPGNSYDSHTLREVLEETQALTGREIERGVRADQEGTAAAIGNRTGDRPLQGRRPYGPRFT